MVTPDVSETAVRVNYSETDQMGVVYHARYLVWLDIARTEHLRLSGMSYRELEAAGLRLAVSEVAVRYRQPARYDDPRAGSLLGARPRLPPGGLRLRGRARRRRSPPGHGLHLAPGTGPHHEPDPAARRGPARAAGHPRPRDASAG